MSPDEDDTRKSGDIVADALSAVVGLEHQVEWYDELVEQYQETGDDQERLQEAAQDVADYWEQADQAKERIDKVITALDIEIDNGEAEFQLDSVESLLHNTYTADDIDEAAELAVDGTYDDFDDEAKAAIVASDYEDLAEFNKKYVEALATINSHEQYMRDKDAFDSPEQLRADGDEAYVELHERVEQQIEILEQAKEQF
ncbi:MAG: hypothetical protein SV186_03660 [Candidatus Nanohaloarchaea archaeon]|nr:hypothetical protein [Candidatus Nanohaloarchaea archaeon]